MSRIHEALKRAEQDRAAFQGGQLEAPLEPMGNGITSEIEAATMSFEAVGVAHSRSALRSYEDLMELVPMEQWRPDLSTMLFFGSRPDAMGLDQFRTLRSRLSQLREHRALQKVLVTSSMPKEGKSFVSANLAQALVQQDGCKVLLIDGDLRASHLHVCLGTKAAPGLTEYLSGEAEEVDILQRGQMENLFFIPSGRKVPNPTELVGDNRFKILLTRLQPLFDWIIVDAPPAIPVSDASLLARECDGVLMVVRSHFTAADVAQRARQEFSDQMLLGAVLNGDPDSVGGYQPAE